MKSLRLLFRVLYYPSMYILKVINMLSVTKYMSLTTSFLRVCGITINGKPNYISSDVYFDNFQRITLNEGCVISKQVVFLTHDFSITTAIKALGYKCQQDVSLDGDIVIGKNVFIGLRTTILPGSSVGENTVIGAGSLIKGNIPANVVVVGNPAKILMTIEEYMDKKKNKVFLRKNNSSSH